MLLTASKVMCLHWSSADISACLARSITFLDNATWDRPFPRRFSGYAIWSLNLIWRRDGLCDRRVLIFLLYLVPLYFWRVISVDPGTLFLFYISRPSSFLLASFTTNAKLIALSFISFLASLYDAVSSLGFSLFHLNMFSQHVGCPSIKVYRDFQLIKI